MYFEGKQGAVVIMNEELGNKEIFALGPCRDEEGLIGGKWKSVIPPLLTAYLSLLTDQNQSERDGLVCYDTSQTRTLQIPWRIQQ